MKLQPYDNYKESGVDWIKSVPSHWELTRMKNIADVRFSNVNKKSYEDQKEVELCNYVDVYKNDFIDDSIDFMLATANANEFHRFKLRSGDVLITKDSESFDDIANPAIVRTTRKTLVCGYHLAIIATKSESCLGDYAFRLFQSSSFNYYFSIRATGITRVGLGIGDICDAAFFLPPLPEQTRIANYLDRQTHLIDRKIELLQKKRDYYDELKQALINETVCRGLDKNAPLKDSGVEWIGKVPAHWEVKRLKDVAEINPSTNKALNVAPGGLIEFLPMSSINEKTGAIKSFLMEPYEKVSQGYTAFKNQDVLLAKITPCFENGNTVTVKGLKRDLGFGSTEFIVFRAKPNTQFLPELLHFFFMNRTFLNYAENFMIGSAGQKRIPTNWLATQPIPVPSLLEQQMLVDDLKKKKELIEIAGANIHNQINTLQELRKTLINDVVTGKVRVPETD